VAVAMIGSVAGAQPASEPTEGPPVAPVGSAAPVGAAAPVGPAPPVAPAVSDEDTGRPAGMSVGIGVGYALPRSLETPNTTSVRLRFASGLTLEPRIALAVSRTEAPELDADQREITLASVVRYPLRTRHKIDLEAIGGLALAVQTTDPRGDHNTHTVTSVQASYGIALAYWVTPHWNLSLTALNPLIAASQDRQEVAVGGTMTTRTTTFGVIFEPQVIVMLHLYD